jgi:MFS family permease
MPLPPDTVSNRVRQLPRAVWLLGLASLFTDTASEAIYPLLPLFLTHVLGGTALALGIVEGAAEAANSLLKIASGLVSDRWKVRRPIVVAGYSLSSAARPLIAVVTSWPQVLAVRFVDRVGKGIRGAPRDAMLASWALPGTRGFVFGFHRAMDHAGAMLGPLLASLFLLLYPGRFRLLFALTIVPGVLAVWMLLQARDRADAEDACGANLAIGAGPDGGCGAAVSAADTRLPRTFHLYTVVLLVFTLGNSTDAFLLLRFSDLGFSAAAIPLLWAALHVVKATSSVYGGVLSDRLGRRLVIGGGWTIYAVVYAAFAVSTSPWVLVAWFLLYGLYYGLSEGTERALVADLAPASRRGAAFGIYNGVIGVGSLAASVVFGLVWKARGAAAAFGLGAALALVATVLLFAVIESAPRKLP